MHFTQKQEPQYIPNPVVKYQDLRNLCMLYNIGFDLSDLKVGRVGLKKKSSGKIIELACTMWYEKHFMHINELICIINEQKFNNFLKNISPSRGALVPLPMSYQDA